MTCALADPCCLNGCIKVCGNPVKACCEMGAGCTSESLCCGACAGFVGFDGPPGTCVDLDAGS